MIIDMHNHILPDIDDGSQSMEETKKMLHIAIREGINGIVATPHYEAGMDDAWIERYDQAFWQVRYYIREKNLPIKLYRGNEIFYSDSVLEDLRSGKARTIHGTNYVLVEFAPYVSYNYIEKAMLTLLNAGYFPIIAHTERYHELREVRKIRALVEMGVCIQVNTGSIMGKMGRRAKWFSHRLLKKELVHLVATDAHGHNYRRPMVQHCFVELDKMVGVSYRRLISEKNPAKILKGERICEKD